MELNIASRNIPTDIVSAVFLVSLAGSGGERSRVEKVKSKMSLLPTSFDKKS